MNNTNPDMWKCPRCGQGPLDCRCPSRIDRWTAILAAVLLAILLSMPASAQCCDGEGEEPASTSQLYLPLVTSPARRWFTSAELIAAQSGYGFDPAIVSEHTWCELDDSALPPSIIRYDHCLQHWYAGQPTDGRVAVYYWFDGVAIRMLLISSTSEE